MTVKFKLSVFIIFIFGIQHSVAGSMCYDVINQTEKQHDVTMEEVPVADNNTVCLYFVIKT